MEVSGIDLRPALGGVGLRYRVADQTVLGTSVGLSLSRAETDADGSRADVSSAYDVSLSTWLEQHVGRRSRLASPFVGVGVRGRLFDRTQTRQYQTVDPLGNVVEVEIEQTVEGFSIGGGLLLGAEVRLAKGVTLGGAYIVVVLYDQETFQADLPDVVPPEPVDRSQVRFDTGTSNLALSVTF